MTGPGDEATVTQKVLFTVEQEPHLEVLAPVLSEALACCEDPDQLGAIIAMSPGLTLALLTMTGATRQKGGSLSIERLVRGLKPRAIRSLLLGIDLYGDNPAPGASGSVMIQARQSLVLHSVAVAICARKMAELEQGRSAGDLAYLAGLFHDCGKLALEQALPRGYAQVRDQADADHCGILHAERLHLGTDHAVLGKRLTRQWNLSTAVVHAAWLHHTPLVQQLTRVPGHQIAHWVRLANMLVHDVDRELETSAAFTQALGGSADRITQIRDHLEARLPEVEAVVMQGYHESLFSLGRQVRLLARQIDRDEQALHHDHLDVQATQVILEAGHQLLLDSPVGPSGLVPSAQTLLQVWQRQFQTGAVGVIALSEQDKSLGTLVLRGDFGQPVEALLEVPEEARNRWLQPVEGPLLHAAEDHLDWLFCQLEFSLDLTRMHWLPLTVGDDVKGILFFEQNYPVDTQRFEEPYGQLARAGALLLSWHLSLQSEQQLAEAILEGLGRPQGGAPVEARKNNTSEDLCQGLGEMAAGFAHEINNPLSVITGRAQLLGQQVSEQEALASLRLIQDNVQDMASLVESLMGFAEPPQPRPGACKLDEMIGEAIELAQNKLGQEHLEIAVDLVDADVPDVWVDSAQIVASLANLITNAVESYEQAAGPVAIRVSVDSSERINLRIEDQGTGMSDDVLSKACYPFYSNKPAGRQRGMGLAFASRLIQLNGGLLRLESLLGHGTTALVELPLVS